MDDTVSTTMPDCSRKTESNACTRGLDNCFSLAADGSTDVMLASATQPGSFSAPTQCSGSTGRDTIAGGGNGGSGPDDFFLSLLAKSQSRRMDEQRCSLDLVQARLTSTVSSNASSSSVRPHDHSFGSTSVPSPPTTATSLASPPEQSAQLPRSAVDEPNALSATSSLLVGAQQSAWLRTGLRNSERREGACASASQLVLQQDPLQQRRQQEQEMLESREAAQDELFDLIAGAQVGHTFMDYCVTYFWSLGPHHK
ncbi:unnamed protein product [Protopolystoma xenopodis]|uniref:Uncharacterized protein n=1 Tax=Protopolystoma xenopodis TaxID=117903 RepID=A0A448WCK8_9PLAT|nr:unnamed protein product [Protopolystoma xenopodis]